MASAAILRRQIEAALAPKIPSALTPAAKVRAAVHATGICALDELMSGGLPEGALSELVGPECSGRTSVALAFLARMTRAGKVCAWIDVTDALDPVSAAAAGVDLNRMLWVRCGVTVQAERRGRFNFKVPEQYFVPPVAKKGLHGGGFGGHPRGEIKGLADAVGSLDISARCAEPVRKERAPQAVVAPVSVETKERLDNGSRWKNSSKKPWGRMEQAMRAADLLLQAGGFSAVVIDMGALKPEFVSRVPLATWFRYRAAAERTRACVVLLTQYACAKSSAEVVVRMEAEEILAEPTVFAGLRPRAELVRQRFSMEPSNVVSIRKPPKALHAADALRARTWQSTTVWTGTKRDGL